MTSAKSRFLTKLVWSTAISATPRGATPGRKSSNAFDDFLPGVAPLGVADMAVLQTSFVRNLLFAEVIAEPRHPLFKAQGAQCRIAGGSAARSDGFVFQDLPKRFQVLACGQKLCAHKLSRRAADDGAGN